MKFNETKIQGCYLISPFHHTDERGDFVKVFNYEAYSLKSLDFELKEIYYSTSKKNVLRGFHFQSPPMDHTKIVSCIKGSIIDFVLDLRMKSETYGHCIALKINDQNKKSVYIPKGCAHGFLSLKDDSIVSYFLETVYDSSCDSGILWSSIDLPITIDNPILSERDKSFQLFKDFNSPFL